MTSLKIRESFTILMARKLGQSTLLVKVDFKGLLSVVAFADFFYACDGLHTQIDVHGYPKSSRQLRKLVSDFFTENQLFGSSAGSDLQAISIPVYKHD